MSVFLHYARYYDLLYQDKDYRAEAAHVRQLLEHHAPGRRELLELGCGTGRHALELATAGYRVFGVDRSEHMVARANERLGLNEGLAGEAEFAVGDIRHLEHARRFDAVIALFHVFSYQTGNDDLLATLGAAHRLLSPGGVLLFDCWYGPAVLTQRPETRVKRLEDERIRVTRIAEPQWDPNTNRVDVNYQVLVIDKRDGRMEELRETHSMRYLFLPEIDLLLERSGFMRIEAAEWMSGKALSEDTWSACVCARRLDR